MGGGSRVRWETCSEDGCRGIRLRTGDRCLAHADSKDRDAELKRFAEEGSLDARGVRISAELLKRILDAAPRDEDLPNRSRLHGVQFDGAIIGDGAWFHGASFGDGAVFDGVTFGSGADFRYVTFGDGASFKDASFGDAAMFHEVTFGYHTLFGNTTFGDDAKFLDVTFGDAADFGRVTFGDGANFRNVFDSRASFGHATFGDWAWFAWVTFGDLASFHNATFGAHAHWEQVRFGFLVEFDDAKIGDWAQLGPVVAKEVMLRRAIFGRSPDLAISADRLRCPQAKFPDGARRRVRWAEIVLDNADFGRPSVLEATPALEEFTKSGEKELVEDPLTDTQPYRTARPRPVCLAGCDVHDLLLVDCDLRACRFTDAHNLAALRLEGTIILPSTPLGWRAAWTPPLVWRWGRRQTIAEEHYWRQRQPRPQGWRGAPPPDPSPYVAEWHDHGERGDPSNPHGPREVASVYRALRKGREDNKDEPGAADFYYGEMEMRRHDRTKPKAERLVLWLYWLTSGYALRSSRALAWLAGILVLATVLLAAVGLEPPATVSTVQATITGSPPNQTIRFQAPKAAPATPPFGARVGTAALVAVEGAVFRASEQQLTYVGRLIQATLRFVGPILLALAVLSIRGRVKR
jgi:uncharacterized protein YjbI with pentapeptide repeats